VEQRDFKPNMDRLRSDVNVAIATPMLSDLCTKTYTISLAQTVREFAIAKIRLSILMNVGHSIAQARNRLVSTFMAHEQFTHLLFIDNDHGWSPMNIVRLLEMDKDVVGVVARKKTEEVLWAANIPNVPTVIDHTGAMEILGEIGTGFLLIKRSTFTRMFMMYPELARQHPDENASKAGKENYYALFAVGADHKGREWSEDLVFCKRWKHLKGAKIWCDPGASISHIGTYDYKGALSDSLFGEEAND